MRFSFICVFLLFVFSSCSVASNMAWHGRCTTSELFAFQSEGFLQVDRIESSWVVLLTGSYEERFIRRACLTPDLEEGAVYRFGLRDRMEERKIGTEIEQIYLRFTRLNREKALNRSE